MTFLLASAFAVFLFLILVAVAWLGLNLGKGFLGFFGFGIPMVLAGAAAYHLWEGKPLLRTLGWAALVYAVGNALGLLLLLSFVLFLS